MSESDISLSVVLDSSSVSPSTTRIFDLKRFQKDSG